MANRLRDGIIATARAIGADPLDLATAISYETAGTFDPTKRGPTTQWGQHRGLIQFGEPQARRYGVDWNDPIGSQLGPNGAVANYFRASGFKPGMSGLDLYSTINAGAPGRYRASDANNGGAPGDVRDKWERQMGGHRAKARALLGGASAPTLAGAMANRTSARTIGTPTPADAPSASMPGLPAPMSYADGTSVSGGLNIAPEEKVGPLVEAMMSRQVGGSDGKFTHPLEVLGEIAQDFAVRRKTRQADKANASSLADAMAGANLSPNDRAMAQLDGTREGLIDVLRGRQQREQANAERAYQDQWRRFQTERQMARDGLADERWNVTRQDRLDRQGVEDQRWNEGQRLQAERWGVEDGRWEQQFGATQANAQADNARADRSLELQEAAAARAANTPVSVGSGTTLLDPNTMEPVYTPPAPVAAPAEPRVITTYDENGRAQPAWVTEPGQPPVPIGGAKAPGGPPQTNVTVNAGADETAFGKEAGKLQATRFDGLIQQGQAATATLGNMRDLASLATQLQTGKGAQFMAAVGPYAQALGVEMEGLDAAQAFRAITARLAPQMRAPGSGASSDRDVQMFLDALPSLGNTPDGNALIMKTIEGVARAQIEAANIAQRAVAGLISPADAEAQMAALADPYLAFREAQQPPLTERGLQDAYQGRSGATGGGVQWRLVD